MNNKYQKITWISLLIVVATVNVVNSQCADSSEVMLVLGGFTGTSGMIRNVVKKLNKASPIPVIAVPYRSRNGLEECKRNLVQKLEQMNVCKYRKVHFYCFIMGGYVLSKILEEHPMPNIGKVILDRSPYQEEVSIEVQKTFNKRITKLLFGQTIIDLGAMEYKFINAQNVGLLIESKPGLLSKLLHQQRVAQGVQGKILTFEAASILYNYGDAAYVKLHHLAMYRHVDTYSSLITNFVKSGMFYDTSKVECVPGDTLFYGVNRDVMVRN